MVRPPLTPFDKDYLVFSALCEGVTASYCIMVFPARFSHSGTLAAYNSWLEETVEKLRGRDQVGEPVGHILGFFMGFRKDHPVFDTRHNTLLKGSKNLHQGTIVRQRCVENPFLDLS